MDLSSFAPHPLIRGGHLQTVVAHLASRQPTFHPEEVLTVTMSDGDQVAVDINLPKISDMRTPIVLMFHGLGGCSESHYNLRIAQKLNALGFRAARYNHRGCGRHNLKSSNIYHSGSTDDLRTAIDAISRRWPKAPILVAGFSLSGTILLNLLGRQPDLHLQYPQLKRAVCVCPPIDLVESADTLSKLKNAPINRYYVKQLLGFVEKRNDALPVLPDPSQRLTLSLFDHLYTARRAGFASGLEYYQACSPKDVVDRIQLPTTVIAAADDPLIPINTVTRAPFSEQVTLRIEKSGGHMGFISRKKTRFGDYRWMDEAVVAWAEAYAKKSAHRLVSGMNSAEAAS